MKIMKVGCVQATAGTLVTDKVNLKHSGPVAVTADKFKVHNQ